MTAAASGINSYDDLVQRCQDWLFGRTDIAAQVPTFIALFEAKANRSLQCRQMENRVVTTIDLTLDEPEFLDLPSDFNVMRRVRLIQTSANKPKLKFATGQQMDDLRAKQNNTVGVPVWFSIFANQMELCPTPNAAYQIEMIYRVNIPALGPANQMNWLLDIGLDAYLYGALMEAAPYLHDDERISVWASGVQAAIDGLNRQSEDATYNAGPLVMRRNAAGYS